MSTLNPLERVIFSELAWFPPVLSGFEEMRPLSFGTWKCMETMKLELCNPEARFTPDALNREMLAYFWLHSEETTTAMIGDCLWDGAWHALERLNKKFSAEVQESFLAWWSRVLTAVQASLVRIRHEEGDRTPAEVIGPVEITHKMALLTRGRAWTDDFVLWHLWLPKALQLYHADLRWHGAHTIAPAKDVSGQDYSDNAPALEGNGPGAFTAPPRPAPVEEVPHA